MKLLAAFMLGLASLTAGAVAAESPSPTVTLDPTWRLAFNDDFDALSLRTGGADQVKLALGSGTWTARWQFAWDPKGSWPNGSEYAWFPDPAYPFGDGYPELGQFSIKDSILTIQAERTPPALVGKMIDVTGNSLVTTKRKGDLFPWVSGTLTTYDSFSVSGPAYFEGRIKIPQGGPGVWPAFWALTKDWRSNGHSEIDFFEFFGKRTNEWQIHVFNGCGSNPACSAKASHVHNARRDLSSDFHVYGCLRTGKEFIFFLDGKQVFKAPVPGKDFAPDNLFILLTLQVGSDLPGMRDMRPDKSTPSPLQMQVDYVRVWAPSQPSPEGKSAHNQADYPTAVAYLQAQADAGDANAANAVGDAFEWGVGAVQSYKEAEKWLRQAAEGGQPDAQLELAKIFEEGRGVAVDLADANKWFSIVAKAQGWPEAVAGKARTSKQ